MMIKIQSDRAIPVRLRMERRATRNLTRRTRRSRRRIRSKRRSLTTALVLKRARVV